MNYFTKATTFGNFKPEWHIKSKNYSMNSRTIYLFDQSRWINNSKAFFSTLPTLTMLGFYSTTQKQNISDLIQTKCQCSLKEPGREDFIERIDYEADIRHPHVKKFNADLIGGNLILLPSADVNYASVKIQWHHDKNKSLMPRFYLENDTIYLKADSLRPFLTQKDAYIIEVTLPSHVDVSVKMYGGTFFIEKINGDLDINMWAGSISGNTAAKAVKASLGVGDIKFSFKEVTNANKISLSCKLGDIKVLFPPGVLLADEVIKKAGKINNRVGADVIMHTWLGDVKIATLNSTSKESNANVEQQ